MLACFGRFGKNYRECLEAQAERQALSNENRESRREHGTARDANRRDTRIELAERGATTGQLLIEGHRDATESANEFFSDWFGGGSASDRTTLVPVPVGGAPAASPTLPATPTAWDPMTIALGVGAMAVGGAAVVATIVVALR